MNKPPKHRSNLFSSLVIPMVIGLALYLCVNLLIDREVITNELVLRYLTGHPISKITMFLFCVGVAGLLVIANNVFDQFCGCDRIRLTLDDSESSPASNEIDRFLDQLLSLKRSWQTQYLWQRLYGALGFVQRNRGTAGIEDELKYLTDMDYEFQQRRYSLVRIVIWATPMLGFLGTVLGISQALGAIQVGPDNDFQSMLNSLRGSLYVAFDTTALALTLSMLLMFFQFFIDRFELQLLDTVQRRANEELTPIIQSSEFVDPQAKRMQRVGRKVLEQSRQLVEQQAEQWQQATQKIEDSWTGNLDQAGQLLQQSLTEAIRQANKELAESISQGVEKADDSMAKRWEQWQVGLSENARQLADEQLQTKNLVESLSQLLEKIENVSDVQQMLKTNLDALAENTRLHDTLQQLSLAVSDLRQMADRDASTNPPRLKVHRHIVPRPGSSAPSQKRKAA